MGSGQDLYKQAKKRIPGGTQLLSKRPEMFLPDQWPSYYERARGIEVWDLDGRRYLDMCYNGVGACILGAADPDVDVAVKEVLSRGNMSTLNCPEEVELAELLCELHPWADQVRYARSGGEAMAVAVRIARAATGRDIVAFCGYHGWHDWYLAANLANEKGLDGHLLPGLEPTGVPRGLRGTAYPFTYNNLAELDVIIQSSNGRLAAVVMEPIRSQEPDHDFIRGVRERASQLGAVLIVDEITAGFRLSCGGAHLVYGPEPDIAVFAKGISNGYPMAAIIGRAEVMEAAQKTFISSTYWTDRIGPTAALATICKHRHHRVHEHLQRVGAAVQSGWRQEAQSAGLPIRIDGIKPLGHFTIEHAKTQAARTLFTKLMLDRGFLATPAFYATFAHTDRHVDDYLDAVRAVFPMIKKTLDEDTVEKTIGGPEAHTGFRRLA